MKLFSFLPAAGVLMLLSGFTSPGPLVTDVSLSRNASEARVVVFKPEGGSAQVVLKDEKNRPVLEQALDTRRVRNEVVIRLSELPEGTYRLKVMNDQSATVKALTIRHLPTTTFGPDREVSVELVE